MTAQDSELVAAARTLAQWGRERQRVWCPDGSSLVTASEVGPTPGTTSSRRGRHAVLAIVAVVLTASALATPRIWRARSGTLVLETVPAGSAVFIDGVESGRTPHTTELPPGPHDIELRYRKTSRSLTITVNAGERTEHRVDWTRKPTGRVAITSDRQNSTVTIDGRRRGLAPITVDDLSVGTHTIVVQSRSGSVRRTVSVREGETATVAASIRPGSLQVNAESAVHLVEDGRPVRLDHANRVTLPPGPHTFRVSSDALGLFEERKVEIEPGKVSVISIVAPDAAPLPAAALGGPVNEPAPAPQSAPLH